jgi:thiol-disulfide isomerase/thioredoxin
MLFLTQENELTWMKRWQALYFYCQDCPWHPKMVVMLDRVQEKYPIIGFFAIDREAFSGLIKRYGITCLPTLLLFFNSQEMGRLIEMLSTSDLIAFVGDIYKMETSILEKNYARRQ